MNCFSPNDDISSMLLKSIPRKAFQWLTQLQQDTSVRGQFDGLSWNFSESCGTLSYTGTDLSLSISWDGHPDDIQSISGSDDRCCDIANNLEWFTNIEVAIYSVMTKFRDSLANASQQPHEV